MSLVLAVQLATRHNDSAQLIVLVNLPVPDTALEAEHRFGATRSAAVRDASLNLRIALDIVSLTVTLAVDLDRARLDSTLVLGSAHIGSLFDLIVAATQLFELGGGFATGHLALRVSKGRCLARAEGNKIVTSTQPLALGAAKAVLD